MLVSFLTTLALALALPITFNLLNHLNVLASDSHEMVELKNHACMILNKKFTPHKLNMAASFLWPHFHQLNNASNPRKGMKILGFSVFKDSVELSKNQNNDIETYTHINVNDSDLNYLLH